MEGRGFRTRVGGGGKEGRGGGGGGNGGGSGGGGEVSAVVGVHIGGLG